MRQYINHHVLYQTADKASSGSKLADAIRKNASSHSAKTKMSEKSREAYKLGAQIIRGNAYYRSDSEITF